MISIEVEFPTNSSSPLKRSKVVWNDGTEKNLIEDLICSAVGLPKPDHYQIKLQNIRGGVPVACSNKIPSGQVFKVIQLPKEGMEFEFEAQQKEQFAPTMKKAITATEEVKENEIEKLKVQTTKTPMKSKVAVKSPVKPASSKSSTPPSKSVENREPTSPILSLLNKSREKNKEYIAKVNSQESIPEDDEDNDSFDSSSSNHHQSSGNKSSPTLSVKKKLLVSANICPYLPTIQRTHYLHLEQSLTVSFNQGNINQDVFNRLSKALKNASERHMEVYKPTMIEEEKDEINSTEKVKKEKDSNDDDDKETEEEVKVSHISAELRELALLEGERMASTMMIEVEREAQEQLKAMKEGVYLKTKEEQEAKERALALKIERVKERIHRENEAEEQSLKEREEAAIKLQKEKKNAELKAKKDAERQAADLAISKLNEKLKSDKEESKLQMLRKKESSRFENEARKDAERKQREEEQKEIARLKIEEEERKRKELEAKALAVEQRREQIRFAEILAHEKAERERLGLDGTDHHVNLEMTNDMRLKINKAHQLSRSASIKSLCKTTRPNNGNDVFYERVSSNDSNNDNNDNNSEVGAPKKMVFTPPTFIRKRSAREVKHVSEKKKVVPLTKIISEQRGYSNERGESSSLQRGSSIKSDQSATDSVPPVVGTSTRDSLGGEDERSTLKLDEAEEEETDED